VIAFLTSLRHPLNSADYGHVEALLEETLASVAAQTNRDFHVFVVGNREPSFDLGPQTSFVGVDFPPPVDRAGPQFELAPFVRDKGTKIGIALAAARALTPNHVMIFDADDYVHKGIAEFAATDPHANGWFVDEGYIYSRARQAYRVQKRFFGVCGTCHVVNFDAYEVPQGLSLSASQAEVEEAYGETLPALLGAHRNSRVWLSKRGRRLDPLPFRGAVYQVDTGENHSGKALAGFAHARSRKLERDFAVPALTSRAVAMARAWLPRG
jgi:hypothetical protein